MFTKIFNSPLISKATKNPLLSGSLLMFFGSNFANFFAYIYHFAMGRVLGAGDYGDLVAFISLLSLLSTVFTFSGLVIIKFVSAAKEDEKQRIYRWFVNKAIKFGLIISAIVLILTPVFAHFLHMPLNIVIFLAPMFLIWLLSFVYRSVLQGLLKFFQTVIVVNTDLIGRLILGLLLIFAGFGVYGAIVALFLGSLLSLLISKRSIKEIEGSKSSAYKPDKKFYSYSIAVFVFTLATNLFLSADLLLAKHYLGEINANLAGLYASVTVLGKTVLYASGPIGNVMFPLVSKRQSLKQEYKKVFLLSLLMTAVVSFGVVILFGLFPELIITSLYGSTFVEASQYLLPYGLFIGLYTLSSLFASYYLSRGKTAVAWVTLIFSLLQSLGIIIFHSSLYEIINVSIFSSFALLIVLLIYFINDKKEQ